MMHLLKEKKSGEISLIKLNFELFFNKKIIWIFLVLLIICWNIFWAKHKLIYLIRMRQRNWLGTKRCFQMCIIKMISWTQSWLVSLQRGDTNPLSLSLSKYSNPSHFKVWFTNIITLLKTIFNTIVNFYQDHSDR